jgi:hypothetical protein
MDAEEIDRRRKKFFDDTEKRKVLIEKICTAISNKEDNTALLDELSEMDSKDCEHGRHWSSTCVACDDIFKLYFPELYDYGDENE